MPGGKAGGGYDSENSGGNVIWHRAFLLPEEVVAEKKLL